MITRASTSLVALVLVGGTLLVFLPGVSAVDESATFKRRDLSKAEDLLHQLDDTPVVGLGKSTPAVLGGYSLRNSTEAAQLGRPAYAIVDASPLLLKRPDLMSLPLRLGDASMLTQRSAATLETLSRKLRVYLDTGAPVNDKGERPDLQKVCTALETELHGKKPEWLRAEAIPTMLQLLTHENKQVRLMLVELLQAIPGKASTSALARRAVFDIDPEVRQTAVVALRDRPLPDSRRVFVEALRYPWPPAADHAAEALVNLNDRDAIGQLVATLDKSDPQVPQPDGKGGSFVREVVRIHHLTNCLLCHPPASSSTDPVLGADPVLTQAQANAALSQASQSLASTPGAHAYGGNSNGALLLRGDVTFLRQDFSLLQTLPPDLASLQATPGPLSAPTQRFDFVVRKRPIPRKEEARLKDTSADRGAYPQQESVLFALRELTGRNEGKTYADWLKKYPDAVEEARAAKLSDTLSDARGAARQEQLLSQYRDSKGIAYTLALARTIPRIEGRFQEKARDALVKRLERMTPATLQERLHEEEAEMRRAAVLAYAHKGDSDAVPAIMGLLGDKDGEVIDAAVSGLRDLTGKQFSAPEDWQAWWHTTAAAERAKR
jgi:HEAT repeat protein